VVSWSTLRNVRYDEFKRADYAAQRVIWHRIHKVANAVPDAKRKTPNAFETLDV
jgi:hypothetical protein